jgi:hypothetical protein
LKQYPSCDSNRSLAHLSALLRTASRGKILALSG